MFSINIKLKFALIALFLGGGIVSAFFLGIWWALPLILIGLGFLVSYVLLGTVQSAAEMVQNQQFEDAEERLGLTWKPEWLYKTNRAFFYMMKGTIAMNKKELSAAEEYLNKANSIELPSDNEKGMVLLQLANIYASKNNWTKAKVYLNTAKKLKISEPMLKEQFKMFEKAMSNRGQMKVAQQMQGRKGFRKGFKSSRRPR